MVSIVLVTFNRAARLRLSIQDILNQTFKDFELIICDDCSTDSTELVCRQFAEQDPRIRYFRQKENIKMPANCNFGIEQARSEYVAILHDGDRFRRNLIEQWYQAISGHESVGFVFNSIGETDQEDRIVNASHEFEEGLVDRNLLLRRFFRRWRFDSPVYGEAMVRKSLLSQRGFLHDEFGFYADVDLWMDLLNNHDAYYCADTLITGPTNEIQPRLFDDNIIHHFLLMVDMQFKHRKKAFRSNPLRLSYELILLGLQSSFYLFYCLMLIVKNDSFTFFMRVPRLLGRRFGFLSIWAVTLILYPILYPLLVLSREWLRKKKQEPSHWLNWLLR